MCVPLTDSQEYDLIVEMNGLKKVQVKTSRCLNKRLGVPRVELRTKSGRWSTVKHFDSSVDLLFVVTDDACYLIPASEVGARTEITLGEKWSKYKLER